MNDWTEAELEVEWLEDTEASRAPIGHSFRPDVSYLSEGGMHPGFVLDVTHALTGTTQETVVFRWRGAPLSIGAEMYVMRGNTRQGFARVLSLNESAS